MFGALVRGLRAVARSWGLVALLLAVNVGVAALLAVPLAATLEKDLAKTDAAAGMLYGADYAWWSQWGEGRSGYTASFAPDLLGSGFAFKNVDLLLKGRLPAGLLAGRDEGSDGAAPDPVILGLGVSYLIVQTFLLGGVLGAWTMRGLLHGSGFYFGRLVRVALLALVADWVLFRLNAPFARWADRQAMEAVSETTALAWSFTRHALLLLAVLGVNMVSCYAKVIVVLEERSSALLAVVSSVAFCVANLASAFGHYLAVAGLGVLLLALFTTAEGLVTTTGYKTQLVALVLGQGLVFGRIALRLALLAGQMALYRGQTPEGR